MNAYFTDAPCSDAIESPLPLEAGEHSLDRCAAVVDMLPFIGFRICFDSLFVRGIGLDDGIRPVLPSNELAMFPLTHVLYCAILKLPR